VRGRRRAALAARPRPPAQVACALRLAPVARPDEDERVGLVAGLHHDAVDRLRQARIVEFDREVVPAFLAALLPRGADLDIASLAGADDAMAGGLVGLRFDRLEHHFAGRNREGRKLARVGVAGLVAGEIADDNDRLLLLLKPRGWGLDSDRLRSEASAAAGRDGGGGSPGLAGRLRPKAGDTAGTVPGRR
jgi:hypothetical protein